MGGRGATAIRSRKRSPEGAFTVRAQGIEGARSGRVNHKKIHVFHVFFLVAATEPPQSPVGVAGCAKIIDNYALTVIHF
jgi:hypothetical protein